MVEHSCPTPSCHIAYLCTYYECAKTVGIVPRSNSIWKIGVNYKLILWFSLFSKIFLRYVSPRIKNIPFNRVRHTHQDNADFLKTPGRYAVIIFFKFPTQLLQFPRFYRFFLASRLIELWSFNEEWGLKNNICPPRPLLRAKMYNEVAEWGVGSTASIAHDYWYHYHGGKVWGKPGGSRGGIGPPTDVSLPLSYNGRRGAWRHW